MGRLGGEGRVEVVGVARDAAQVSGVAGAQLVEQPEDLRALDVAVVDLPHQVLDVARPLGGRRRVLAEERPGDLEDVAQPLRGDAQVVEGLDFARVERARDERVQLGQAHADDPLGGVGERHVGIEPLDAARLHAARASSTSVRRRPRRSLRSMSARAAARSALAAAWRERSRDTRTSTPGRSWSGAASA